VEELNLKEMCISLTELLSSPHPLQIPRERKKLEIEVENDLWLGY